MAKVKLPQDVMANSLGIAPDVLEQLKAQGLVRGNKYRNRRFVREGERWDSEKEYTHWLMLRVCEASGRITGLNRQVEFPLVVNGVKVCSYRADFVYEEGDGPVVVDVKSPITRKLPVYRIKKKLMLALYGIRIREV